MNTDTTEDNLIQCRASNGIAIPASKPWVPGEPVEFIYAPAGKHLITAGFRRGETITICVENDEQTAIDLQASFDHLTATEPNQEPFGDEEHDAKKATLRFPNGVTKFSWGQIKGNEGVVVAAEPTSYGAEAVNGKVYRSWSPEFATDAEYGKAKCKAGHWSFPEGVRGSQSNPARIVGVSFVMGALTNKPAFRAMPPVKAKKADGDRGEISAAEPHDLKRLSEEAHHATKNALLGRGAINEDALYSDARNRHLSAAKAYRETEATGLTRGDYDRLATEHENLAKHHKDVMKNLRGYEVKSSSPGDRGEVIATLPFSTLLDSVQACFKEPVCDICLDNGEWSAVYLKAGEAFRTSFSVDENGEVEAGTDVEDAELKASYQEGEVCFNGEKIVNMIQATEKPKKIKARPFGKEDWYGLAGAERPSEHEEPLVAEREHPNGHSWTAVADKNGLQVMHSDKEGQLLGHHQLDIPFHSAKHLIEPAINAESHEHLAKMGFKWHPNPSAGHVYPSIKSRSALDSIYSKAEAVKANEPDLNSIYARVGENG